MAIDLRQVMEIIKSEKWMMIRCFTADLVKNTGGKLITYTKCRIARRHLLEESKAETSGFTGNTRSAKHNFHFTVNLELENGQIRTVHPALIYSINNEKVL